MDRRQGCDNPVVDSPVVDQGQSDFDKGSDGIKVHGSIIKCKRSGDSKFFERCAF